MTVAAKRVVDRAETQVFLRLLEWAVWATDRRDYFDRYDDVTGTFRITQSITKDLNEVRDELFPTSIDAVEKAVATLKREEGALIHHLLLSYFLQWKAVDRIATEEDLSEHHVTEYILRGIFAVARLLPECDRRAAADAKSEK